MNKKKIAVGMSGGVDSSVSALLLKQAGYEVIGITMLLKPLHLFGENEDPLKEAKDAAAVCEKIGIKHYTPDFRDEFQKNVIDYFIDEYTHARTPNPCIACNFTMKFGRMIDYAIELGCDAVATGHYAQVEEKNGEFFLKRSDSPKDQSYFLYTLNQFQLSHTLFPLICREKAETREIAREYGLPVAFKSDSQDICFVKNGDYVGLIESYTKTKAKQGDFIDESGKILGKHQGLYRYTVGQRKGLGIALGERAFVTKIDAENNTVILGTSESGICNSVLLENVHFINMEKLEKPMNITVKTRYRAKPVPATISNFEDKIKLEFELPQQFICPGQAAVFYQDDVVLGGGTIL